MTGSADRQAKSPNNSKPNRAWRRRSSEPRRAPDTPALPDSAPPPVALAAQFLAASFAQAHPATVVLTHRTWWQRLTQRTSRRSLRGHSRRRDPALLNPLAYEQLDKRQLLASGDDTSGDPPNLLLDLPPVASSTLQQLLSSSGGFSSGLWQQSPDQLNYNAGNWAAQLTPQQFDARDWSGYTINTSVPSGFSVSNLKSIVPLEENNGYLVLVRQRTTGRTLSGGGPAGGGLEGGGGGMGGGSEQVDSLVLSSIFHVRTQAEADAINPLTYNPADFPSRMVVTSNTQFNFRDTTIAGQVRSVAVALTYQVSLNFTWGGSWTSREGSTGESSNERRVNYASSGTVWFSGGHTYVGVVNMTPSGELLEVGFALGSGLSGVYLTSANVTTLSHSSGSLAADGSGLGTRGQGTLTADLLQTRHQLYGYVENSSRWLSSGQRQSSLARKDTIAYTLLSNPRAELNYSSRQDLAPADAGEVFGFEQPSNPPSGSTSSTSFVARAGGALTSHSRLNATGHRVISTGINTAYDGKRDINFGSSGVDHSDTQGSRFTAEQSLEYDYQSPERLANNRLTYSSTGEGGDVTLVVPSTMLLLEDLPTTNDADDILSGVILSRSELPVSKLKTKSTLSVDSRGAYATQRGGATPGAAASLLAGASGYLGGHTPAALVASGSSAALLRPHTAPVGDENRQLNFYWNAWKNESESDTTLDQIARFNSEATFTPGGGTSVSRDGRRDDRTVFSGKSSYSSDALSYWGHAPKVTRTENWTAAQGADADPYTLADADQTGSGAFSWAHRGLQNNYAGRGNDGLQYDLTLGFTPPGQGDAPQGTFGQHSGTVLRAPEGEVSLSGTRGSSSSTVYDLDQTNTQDKFFSAAFERTGQASGNHRFLKALDSYDFSRTALGSGSWSSAAGGELSRGLREGDSQSDGSWSQSGNGNGLSFRLYDLDEKVTAAPASQTGAAGGSTLGGLLQLSGGMDRTLQYKFRDLAPLSSQLSDSSSWTSDFQNSVRDLEDDSGGSGGGSGSPPGGSPSYLVNVGEEAQTKDSGSGTSEDDRTETFRIAGQQRSEIWNLAATGGSGLDGSPTEINRSGMLSLVPSDAPRTITITDGVIWTDEFLADGLHRTGNGERTTTEDLKYKRTNPSEIRNREVVARTGGGSDTTTLSIAAGKLGLEVNDLTTVTENLENFGDIITKSYTRGQPDEQIITPGWEVDYDFRTTGKLTETTTSVGSGLQTGELKRRVERSTPLVGGGWSEHTDTWQRVPVWNTTDTTIVEGTASGGDKLEHRIGGKFGELVWLGTEGEHFYDEQVQDSYVNGLANELRVGNYRTLPVALESRAGRDDGIFAGKLTPLAGAGLVWSETARSGSVLTEYDSDGNLLAAEGLFTHQIESGGDAAAEDYEQATRTFGDWNSQREFERTSNDHFRSSRTRTWTPSVSGEGTVDYQSTDAAFEQKFWGSFGESDTRSVQQGSNWRVPETTLVRSGQYGSGAANPLTRSSSGGHALDSGFYDGGFASWGYEGQAIHTRFDSAIGPGSPQSPSTWDDSTRADMGSGPNLLRQDGGGVDGGQENDPAFNDVQAILRKFHEKYPGDEDFTKFFLSGGNIKIQELTRLWGDGTYSVGSGLAGDTIYLDKSQIDKLGPEMAADELKRVLTNLANNNGSQTHNFLDGFDPQRFLDNIEANQLPLSVFFRPTQMDGAAAGQFEGGFIAIIENAPGVGLYVVIGQGVTGERLTFAVPPGGNTQLSMGERCLYLATGIGPVAMVVVGKGAGAVIKSLARITPDGLHVPITLEELAQAANLVDNAPKGTGLVDDAAGAVGREPNRIYSAHELIRRGTDLGPNHNFPESFNDIIFSQGTKTRRPNFFNQAKPGLGADSIQYRMPGVVNGKEGVFEIFTRPSLSGRTEVIMHRFFRPNK